LALAIPLIYIPNLTQTYQPVALAWHGPEFTVGSRFTEAVENDEGLLKAILPLTDVMGTGHHAAVSAGVKAGGTVAVVGDGAVGLCGVLAAKRLGAGRIIMMGRHEGRLKLARQFGATDFVKSRGDDAIQDVQLLTGGGAESVLEG
jgi:threonine dehydrogenase-like Zn-dependent dehydrogenase